MLRYFNDKIKEFALCASSTSCFKVVSESKGKSQTKFIQTKISNQSYQCTNIIKTGETCLMQHARNRTLLELTHFLYLIHCTVYMYISTCVFKVCPSLSQLLYLIPVQHLGLNPVFFQLTIKNTSNALTINLFLR